MEKGNNTVTVSVTISRELLKKVDKQAKDLYISRSAYIVTALAQKIQSEELMKKLPKLTESLNKALKVQAQKNPLGEDVNPEVIADKYKKHPDTEIPYMDATREGAEKLDFIQGLEKDNDTAK